MARNARLLAGLATALVLCLTGVGSVSAASPSFGALIEHWDGTAWTQVASPAGDELSAIAVVSPDDVWALGAYKIHTAVAVHWDGVAWKQVPIPTPKGADEVVFQRAAADSATDIWVVGAWAGGAKSGGYRTLVEHWNGSAWKIVRSPDPSDNARLAGVTALSPKNVWAVGEYVVPKQSRSSIAQTLVLHWNGKKWKRVPSPNPSHANPGTQRHDDVLSAVDAVSARNVWAVGNYFRRAADGRHSYQTLVIHWNGKHWKRVSSPDPGRLGHANALYDVATISAADVWAVGGYYNGSGAEQLLTERWDGSSWQAVPVSAPFSQEQQLTSVAPLAADDVWAAGSYLYDPDLAVRTVVEHWDGHAWAIMPTPNPALTDSLSVIAAVSPTDVWAVGSYSSG